MAVRRGHCNDAMRAGDALSGYVNEMESFIGLENVAAELRLQSRIAGPSFYVHGDACLRLLGRPRMCVTMEVTMEISVVPTH